MPWKTKLPPARACCHTAVTLHAGVQEQCWVPVTACRAGVQNISAWPLAESSGCCSWNEMLYETENVVFGETIHLITRV